jgi:uncharacterized repeat protein (TIGR01451 family)
MLSLLNDGQKRNGHSFWRQRRLKHGRRPTLERLEDRTLFSINSAGFYGMNYDPNQGATPPDTVAAAGPTYVVEAVNQSLFFGSKATLPGSLSATVETFDGFFPGFTHSFWGLSDVITDPSVNYDAATGQWIISILDVDLQNDKGYLNIAVSNTSDPTGAWTKFQLDLTDGHGPIIPGNAGLTLWGDFERFGSCANAYVWTVNMFSFSAGGIDQNSLYDHVQVIAIDKSNLSNVHTVNLPGWDSSSGTITNENLLPVRMDSPTAADGMWFAEETNYGDSSGQASTLRLVHVANILTAGPSDFVNFTGNVPTYQFTPVPDPSGGGHAWNNGDALTPAVQLGSADTIETNDTRIDSAVMRTINGQQHLVLTQTVNSPNDTGITKARWYDFNTTAVIDPSVPVPLYQSGEINPGPGVFTSFPSAAIDPAGDIGMTYVESSANEDMSMYFTGKALSESAMEQPVLLLGGDSALTGPDGSPHRAGDYSGTTVDIDSNGNVMNAFWSANEYTSGGFWATGLVNFSISVPLPAADMTVTASGPSTVTAGTNATYTITITNNGPNAALGVVITDTLPAGSTFISITQTSGTDNFSLAQSGGSVTEHASANVASGSSDTFSVVVFAPSSLNNGAAFNDTTSVSATNPDPNSANNSVTVTGSIVNTNSNADLAVTVSGPVSASEGNTVTYNITSTNSGPSSASGVTLTDTLPSNLAYQSATASQGTFSISGGVLTFSLGTMPSGGSFTASVTALAIEDGNTSDSAAVSSNNPDPNAANNNATATTAFTEPAINVSGAIHTKSKKLSNFLVATFTHANGVEPARAFTATIDWGDGTTSVGTITLSGTTYSVKGTHIYTSGSSHTITTSVTEIAGPGGILVDGSLGPRNEGKAPSERSDASRAILAELWFAWQQSEWPGTARSQDTLLSGSSLAPAQVPSTTGLTIPTVAFSLADTSSSRGSVDSTLDHYFGLLGQLKMWDFASSF